MSSQREQFIALRTEVLENFLYKKIALPAYKQAELVEAIATIEDTPSSYVSIEYILHDYLRGEGKRYLGESTFYAIANKLGPVDTLESTFQYLFDAITRGLSYKNGFQPRMEEIPDEFAFQHRHAIARTAQKIAEELQANPANHRQKERFQKYHPTLNRWLAEVTKRQLKAKLHPPTKKSLCPESNRVR